jgi:hypothetical protein
VTANRIREIVKLHKQGGGHRTFLNILNETAGEEKKRFMEEYNKAVSTANMGREASNVTRVTQTLRTESGSTVYSASKAFSKVGTPLLALGGLVGLMAAKEPNTGEAFHQGTPGNYVDRQFDGRENAISKFSEIPGNPDRQEVWYGSNAPFQLDITFSGFIADRMQHDRLQREVYSIISNNMEVKVNNGEVQDNRNKSHRMAAMEAMKGML